MGVKSHEVIFTSNYFIATVDSNTLLFHNHIISYHVPNLIMGTHMHNINHGDYEEKGHPRAIIAKPFLMYLVAC